MSGHSKWHSIKHQKAQEDKKRGKIFSKLSRKISVAAKKGKDPEKNVELRNAVQEAKDNDMPKENIERAILRGSGELPGVEYTEIKYEGYGPGGVALYIECLTDNKNRTASDMRHAMERHGGKLGAEGCVSYLFEKKGLIFVPKKNSSETEVFDAAIEAGALDISEEKDTYEIQTDPADLHKVYKALKEKNIPVEHFELTFMPTATKKVDDKDARKILKLLSILEDSEDVQQVYSNFDIADEILEEIGSEN
ncbi:YebC/PmpR family DNA-binding transcriptional regulator [candidate division WOR-3 bacterium]|nr:YebC/PmpR family DNA-binding transcriptional regulator [candidate division WOR-3 bacterium]